VGKEKRKERKFWLRVRRHVYLGIIGDLPCMYTIIGGGIISMQFSKASQSYKQVKVSTG
jgi:hypothetical protein